MADDIILREPTIEDGHPLHELVRACKPLDENSTYCNLLQCTHFSDTCVVAEMDGRLVGFVTGYLHPKEEGVYFLWQVAVHPDAGGRGLAKRMILDILGREALRGVHTLKTTVTESNQPSRGLFGAIARKEGAELSEEPFFAAEHFGDPGSHEAEPYLVISPLSSPPR